MSNYVDHHQREIAADYASKMPVYEIERKWRLARQTIRGCAEREGIPLRKRGRQHKSE